MRFVCLRHDGSRVGRLVRRSGVRGARSRSRGKLSHVPVMNAQREESTEPMPTSHELRSHEHESPEVPPGGRRRLFAFVPVIYSAIIARLNIPSRDNENTLRARLGDRNRVFLLVSNIYPAILGTMIWALIAQVPSDLVSWIATLLIVSHFTLDLLYLKLNLDFYGAENDFRYGWLLFFTDVAIVALIRVAFGTIPELTLSRNALINPITSFTAIYILYVVWEHLYYRLNSTEKRSPASSATHYWYLAGWFALCAGSYAICVGVDLPDWILTATVTGFLVGVTAACVELYWSVFLAINDTRTDKAGPSDNA